MIPETVAEVAGYGPFGPLSSMVCGTSESLRLLMTKIALILLLSGQHEVTLT